MSIGGNDAGDGTMMDAIGPCLDLVGPLPTNGSNKCAAYLRRTKWSDIHQRFYHMYLRMFLDAKQRANPKAVILAMGYMQIFHPTGDTRGWNTLMLNPEAMEAIRHTYVLINQAMKKAALKAGIVFYDPSKDEPRALSGSGFPFIRYMAVTPFPEFTGAAHPTITGHMYLASGIKRTWKETLDARAKAAKKAMAKPSRVISTFPTTPHNSDGPDAPAGPAVTPPTAPAREPVTAVTPRSLQPEQATFVAVIFSGVLGGVWVWWGCF